jgi:excinuclease UvrABC helicase subunit UvrB
LEVELQKGRDAEGQGGRSRGKQRPKRVTVADFGGRREVLAHLQKLREEMQGAAKNLDFETAAAIRDEIFRLEKIDLELR